jgi:hypothetical protein
LLKTIYLWRDSHGHHRQYSEGFGYRLGITRYALCMPDGLFHAHIHPATETARFNDSKPIVPGDAPHITKGDRVSSGCEWHAEIVASVAPRKRQKMSALRPQIKILKDWRTHCVVLSPLSEAPVVK